ncbi:MAG: sigma-70 family RNA polymerase sigma factor [Planctomycetes bacterium]|nr:sigma-70 family RNA polymerase sigma factor [Planctomycetota bacterium]
MTATPDHELVAAIVAGDGPAFEELVARFQDRVLRLLSRFTRDPAEVEDLAQDVFLKVFRKLHTFQQDSGLYTWIYRVAVNTANDHLARRGRRRLRLLEDEEVLGGGQALHASAPAPTERLVDDERRAVTRRLVDELPENFRSVIVLREYEDLSYTAIAEVLGISIGTVESRLFRARQRIRRGLEERYPELVPGTRHDGRRLRPDGDGPGESTERRGGR